LGDFIADNDPVRVLNTVVDNLDISEIEAGYEGGGASSYNPRMLVKAILKEAERELDIELGEEKEDMMTSAEMATLAIVHNIRKLAKLERTDMGHRAF